MRPVVAGHVDGSGPAGAAGPAGRLGVRAITAVHCAVRPKARVHGAGNPAAPAAARLEECPYPDGVISGLVWSRGTVGWHAGWLVAVEIAPEAAQERLVAAVAVLDGFPQLIIR